jgi:adenylate cyclase
VTDDATPSASVPLESIQAAFEGIVPATVASCSADGVPNISYLSIVRRLDSERIAVTNQFLSKTAENIRVNPFVTVRVVDPVDYAQYDLEARYLHSESSGALFDSVRLQLDAVSAQTGMAGTFRLRSVDVLRVDRCSRAGDSARPARPASSRRPLEHLGVFVQRLARSGDLAEATRVAPEALDDLFGFGHSMVLLHDDAAARLFVVAAHGYPAGRIGAEVAMGEGLVGLAAQRRAAVRVAHLGRSRAFAAAVSGNDLDEVAFRGLDDAVSILAAPLVSQDRLLGILYLDSPVAGTFDAEAAEIIEVVAGHLAVTIALLEAGGTEPRSAPVLAASPAGVAPRRARFHDRDGSVFLDGDYVVRGAAGRILFYMLSEHAATGRSEFSNKELRLDQGIGLPIGNDNLEARLLLLRRRLAERDLGIVVERVGRGRLELAVSGPLILEQK